MKKKAATLLAALALSLSAANVQAEQPKAEEYRQMFASGNFYLEYKDDYLTQVIGAKDGKRFTRKKFSGFAGLFGSLFGGEDKTPEIFHQDGKLYQLKFNLAGKRMMIVLPESQLGDENLDPKEGWVNLKSSLALPDALSPLAWNDPYHQKTAAVQPPRFVESGKRMADKKEYDCDTYTSRIVTKSGAVSGEIIYRLMYEAGTLARVETAVISDGKEQETNSLKIKAIEPLIPEDAFKIKKNTKVYGAGIGNMDDLLSNPAQVEVLNESKGDEPKDESSRGGDEK